MMLDTSASPRPTETLEEIFQWVSTGQRIIQGVGEIAKNRIEPRRYKGEELREVVGVGSLQAIYMAEKEGRLPMPDLAANNRRAGATLEQVIRMQEYFRTRPCRQPEEEPVILSFTNFKGGCWKTTTSWYFGSYLASRGYRVLFVDLDPQATLTHNCGLVPDIETNHETGLGPYILGEEGFPPEWVGNTAVKDTYLPNVKIIPASLELQNVEYELSNDVVAARDRGDKQGMLECFFRVHRALEIARQDFDIVVVDGTPSLGLLPLNIIFASDAVVVPVPTEISDYSSTLSFCNLYASQAQTLVDVFGDQITLPKMKFLPTRFSPSEKNATMGSEFVLNQIRKTFGDDCLSTVIKKHDAVVSNLGVIRRTAFDVNAAEGGVNREARRKAMANFSAAFDEIMERVVLPFWPSKQWLLDEKGIY